MIVDACVYQIFLVRTDWEQQAKDASKRVGCKTSVVTAPSSNQTACEEKSGTTSHVFTLKK